MTEKQKLFCDEYLKDLNGTRAYRTVYKTIKNDNVAGVRANKLLKQKDIAEYTYETYIIAIQSNNGYEVKVFKFTPESIEAKLTLISDTIEQICWHKQNNLWDYSRNYYEGDGSEIYNECCDSSIL